MLKSWGRWCGDSKYHPSYYTLAIASHIGNGTGANVSDNFVENIGFVVLSAMFFCFALRTELFLAEIFILDGRVIVAVAP